MNEEKGRNSTAMLTVIAIATLLVAVVGATFAYFSTTTTNSGNVTVSTETKAADVFSATGTAALSLEVTGATMQDGAANAADDYSKTGDTDSASNAITVSLNAGSGTATCYYNIAYVPTTAYSAVQESLIEYGAIGTCSSNANSFNRTNIAGSGTTLTDGASTVTGILLKEDAVISDAAGSGATTQTWSFTGEYYNLLSVDQSSKAGTTFGGEIRVINVRCSNSNS